MNVYRASLVAQLVKDLPAMQETPVQFLGGEDPTWLIMQWSRSYHVLVT